MKNLYSREELRGLARKKARAFVTQTIPKTALEEFERDGWSLLRRNKKSLVISRPKTHDVLLEDQVWTLLYRMGFPNLSGEGGGEVIAPTEEGPACQSDRRIAVDDEVILAVECKSALQPAKRQYFQGELAKHEPYDASCLVVPACHRHPVSGQWSWPSSRTTLSLAITIDSGQNSSKFSYSTRMTWRTTRV